MAQKKRKKQNFLRSQIETQTVPQFDSADPNLGDYLVSFIEECKSIGPLEKINLMSPEEANKALQALTATQAKIERQLKAASALKRLLIERS